MRPLLSTRLFAGTCCSAEALALARAAGFPALEVDADSLGVDLLRPGEPERVARLLVAEGTRPVWLRIGPSFAARLADPVALARFAGALGVLRLEGVVIVGPTGPLDLADVAGHVETSGARLAVERGAFAAAELRRLPRDVELSWDLLEASAEGAGPRDLDPWLGPLTAGRLLGVRVAARGEGGRRVPPGEREAILLEETWGRLRPEFVIYDVDDPSGFGSRRSLEATLAELRSFHLGEKHPHATQPWGLFGSGLAPG